MTQYEVVRKVIDDPMMFRFYQDVGFFRDKNKFDSTENRLFANALTALCMLVYTNHIDARADAEAFAGIMLAEVAPSNKAHELGRLIYALTKSYMGERWN